MSIHHAQVECQSNEAATYVWLVEHNTCLLKENRCHLRQGFGVETSYNKEQLEKLINELQFIHNKMK